ncbi:YIP1 family protein [Planktotalea sp.]|uniref:YIP1 family protein n=1 Tax=Planktotalea sp. TaxID=2029877 RepID=UPI003D6B23F7
MLNTFLNLAVRTVSEPRKVAAELLQLQIERRTLWIALALAVVLNTIAYQISLVLAPPPGPMPVFFSSPIIFAVLIGAGLVMSVFSITYAGRFIGGKARLEGVMTLLIWLQYLRFAVQLATVLLLPIIPGLVALLVLGATFYGMWILLQFIDVVHEFDSLFSSFGALVLAALGIMLGLAILLSFFGVQNLGLTPYV